MTNMMGKTHRALSGSCMYGHKCCASMLHASGRRRLRRTIRASEKVAWKKDLRQD